MIDEEGDNIYTARNLEALLDSGRYVMVDFTANWCPTCKVLEKTVLKTDRVQTALHERGVVQMVADWTKRETDIGKQIEAEIVKLKTGNNCRSSHSIFQMIARIREHLLGFILQQASWKFSKIYQLLLMWTATRSTEIGSDQVVDVHSAQR